MLKCSIDDFSINNKELTVIFQELPGNQWDLQIFDNLTTLPTPRLSCYTKNYLVDGWCSGFEMEGDLDDCELWPQIDVCYALYIIKYYTTILIQLDFKVAHKKSCLVNHLHLEKGASSCIVNPPKFKRMLPMLVRPQTEPLVATPNSWSLGGGYLVTLLATKGAALRKCKRSLWGMTWCMKIWKISCVCSPKKDLWNLNICWVLIC